MILYRDILHRKSAPPGLDGVADLHQREDASGTLWCVGDGRLLGPQPDRAWIDLGDSWHACKTGTVNPATMPKACHWALLDEASDTTGRRWPIPVCLDLSGACKILHAIGPDWQPLPTTEQAKARAVSEWFRAQLDAAESGLTPGMPMVEAAQGAAFLLSLATAISEDTLRLLSIIDEGLIVSVALVASGWKQKSDGL